MAKLKLELEEEVKLKLIGIQSSWPEHRLVWAINKQTGLYLQRAEDYVLISENDDSQGVLFNADTSHFYSVFIHETEEEQAILVANLGQGLALFDRKRKLDYILKISSGRLYEDQCIRLLSEIRGVLAVTRIECSIDDLIARPFSHFV